MMNKVNIYAGNHLVGHVIGDTFFKSVQSSRHFLHKPPSIAFDIASLRQAEAAGAVQVQVYDKDTGKVYRAALDTIWRYGTPFNRSHGEQVRLDLPLWEARLS